MGAAPISRATRRASTGPPISEATGLSGQPNILVAQPSAFTGTARIVGETPLPVLKDYLLLRARSTMPRPILSQPFVDANFAFRGTVLNGTPQNEERWKRGVDLVTDAIPDDVGRIYVAALFPARGQGARPTRWSATSSPRWTGGSHSLAWMAPETRARARAKLAAFTPKIGYPDRWRDYSSVRISRDDLLRQRHARQPSSNISATSTSSAARSTAANGA